MHYPGLRPMPVEDLPIAIVDNDMGGPPAGKKTEVGFERPFDCSILVHDPSLR